MCNGHRILARCCNVRGSCIQGDVPPPHSPLPHPPPQKREKYQWSHNSSLNSQLSTVTSVYYRDVYTRWVWTLSRLLIKDTKISAGQWILKWSSCRQKRWVNVETTSWSLFCLRLHWCNAMTPKRGSASFLELKLSVSHWLQMAKMEMDWNLKKFNLPHGRS